MPESKRPLKVFLCHASVDKPKVRELYRYLKRRGVQPWFDEKDLIGGQDWQVEIPKALSSSDAIVICLTNNSVNKEGYVQKEIKFALDKALEIPAGRIYLIPARFEDCEVPTSLSHYHWIDLFEKNGSAKLMKSLKERASQLERIAVELPKPDETNPYSTITQKKPIGVKSVNLNFIAGIAKTFSETFMALGYKPPKVTPFIRTSIIIGGITVILFGIFLFVRSQIPLLVNPSVTSSPSATQVFTNSPDTLTQIQKPSVTLSPLVTPTPTFTITQLPTATPIPPTSVSAPQFQESIIPPTWTFEPLLAEGPQSPTITPSFTSTPTDIPAVSSPTTFKGPWYSGSQAGCKFSFGIKVSDNDGIASMTLYWKNGSTGNYESNAMHAFSPMYNGFVDWSSDEITITGYPNYTGYKVDSFYYFVAIDALNNSTTSDVYPHTFVGGCP